MTTQPHDTRPSSRHSAGQSPANQDAGGQRPAGRDPVDQSPARESSRTFVHDSSDVPDHLDITDVRKSFGGTEVLKGVDLSVAQGRTTAIVGPSGSGKTTLLRLIAGFLAPASGRIALGGAEVAGPDKWVPAHKRSVGYVAQDGALFPHLSVGANIAFGLPLRGKAASLRVGELLEMVSMDASYAKRRPHQLSGGQQQRVALARALARQPELMLLDEPFSALDAGLRVDTRRAVSKTLEEAGVTTILVTHDQAEALSFADQVAVMRDGKLAQIGSPFVVYTRPADQATAEFLGDAVILEAWLEGSLALCSLGGIPVRMPKVQGKVNLMLRPEQIRISSGSPIRGRVVDTDYFGPETTVRIQLEPIPVDAEHPRDPHQPVGGEVINIRHWNAMLARPGTELFLKVVGEGVVFPWTD